MIVRQPTLRGAALAGAAALACLLPLLADGCGRDPAKAVIATVGPRKVTQAYYETRLGRLKSQDLPRDEQGKAVDTSTLAGRKAFLDIIVNKELMALKAEELGIGDEEQVVTATKNLTEFNAPTLMRADLIEQPAAQISDAEVADYYANLQTQRRCSFIICNFREDAAKARAAIAAGGLWEDVADEHNDGSRGPTNDYRMTVQFGRLEDSFEKAIWALKEGEISQPIETVYGFWVIRVDAIEPVRIGPLETMKQQVLDGVRARKTNLAGRAFAEESRRRHEFKLDEGTLWIVYQALPEGEVLLDPATQKPVPREQLRPLNLATADLDRFFYQVKLDGKLQTFTAGDYKQVFDNSNVFERPKRTEMLGGLRQSIVTMIDRQLLLQEAKERGYMEDPRVLAEVKDRREQIMVTKLHERLVQIDEQITPAQYEEFWQQHGEEYKVQETRYGKAVVCASEESARQAHADALQGKPWPEILARYGSDAANKQNQGSMVVASNTTSPLRDPVFALAKAGDLTAPMRIDRNWIVARLDSIAPPRAVTLAEAANEVGQRILAQRREAKLQSLLAEWKQQYPVRIREKALARVRSHDELMTLAAAPQGAPAAR